jgi:hypothetical protein
MRVCVGSGELRGVRVWRARACVCVCVCVCALFVCVRVATSRRRHVEAQASPTVSPSDDGSLSSEAAVGYAAAGLLITDEAVA